MYALFRVDPTERRPPPADRGRITIALAFAAAMAAFYLWFILTHL